MKKTLFKIVLLLSLIIFNSCNNDDDSTPAPEQIIGKWQLTQVLIDSIPEMLNECDLQSNISFNHDGTTVFEVYEKDFLEGCGVSGSINGLWTKPATIPMDFYILLPPNYYP